ncbi:hypothetical protein ES703_58445 [subsurface metagenome]
MEKKQQSFSIQEISVKLKIPKPTLRFWEKEFKDILVPLKTKGGQRRYTLENMSVIKKTKRLREKEVSLAEIYAHLMKNYGSGMDDLSITERMKESFVHKKERDPRASISQRQACVNKIQKIDASLEKIMGNSSDKLHNVSEKCKGMIDGYLRSLRNIMETVDLIDRELIVMVGAEGENIKTELLKLQDVRQAAKGYRDKIESTPRFLDTIR